VVRVPKTTPTYFICMNRAIPRNKRTNIRLSALIVGPVLLFATTTLLAQLPELQLPSSITGNPTSAKFFGGATTDKGVTYASSFTFDQSLDVLTEIQVETDHVDTVGDLYFIISTPEEFFMRVDAENFELWDGSLETLQPAVSDKALQASEALTLVGDTTFAMLDLVGVDMNIYLAYDSVAAPGELYYSGAPIKLFIQSDPTDSANFTFYVDNISSSIIQPQCSICHSGTGVASTSNLIYENSTVPGYQTTNFITLLDYIENIPNGSELILAKP